MSGSPDGAIAAVVEALGLENPVVTAMAGGALNRSFRLRAGSEDLVLKVAGDGPRGLGASRRAEAVMQSLAADAGLAPPVVYADEARGLIVSRHADGRMPGASEMREPRLLERVGGWLSALHALPPPDGLAIVDFGERAAGYLARLQVGAPARLVVRIARELAARRADLRRPARLVACHHDLHHRNVIDDGRRLRVVDWEYAGPGDPAADVAACVGYHDLDAGGVDALLDGYGRADAEFRERIASLAWVFDCLWFGWNAVTGLAGPAPDAAEQARLAARLAH